MLHPIAVFSSLLYEVHPRYFLMQDQRDRQIPSNATNQKPFLSFLAFCYLGGWMDWTIWGYITLRSPSFHSCLCFKSLKQRSRERMGKTWKLRLSFPWLCGLHYVFFATRGKSERRTRRKRLETGRSNSTPSLFPDFRTQSPPLRSLKPNSRVQNHRKKNTVSAPSRPMINNSIFFLLSNQKIASYTG